MITFEDRARGAMLGHALGDAYGRPLEFTQGEAVRVKPAGPGHDFMWTDDTHMGLYLGMAALDHGPGQLDADRFGACVGAQFSTWLDDPLTPSTAPGHTCMAGARRWRAGRDWRTSGVPSSDGCGAVMRVPPLAIRFGGRELAVSAGVQAAITHGHPNAIEASIAAAWMTRALLLGRPFSPVLVAAAVRRLAGRWDRGGGSTGQALEAAVWLSQDHSATWLDEDQIPDGDGGWRSPSALGLAVAAGLRWGVTAEGGVTPSSFALAVDRAARIDGDSDSVACLVGMLLGAAGGVAALPPGWVRALPQGDRIAGLADALAGVAGAGGR